MNLSEKRIKLNKGFVEFMWKSKFPDKIYQ